MSYAYQVDGEIIRLTLDPRLVAIGFRDDRPLGAQARAARAWASRDPSGTVEIADEDVAIMPAKLLAANATPESEATMAAAIETLRQRPDIAKVWPVFKAGGHTVLATNRLVIGLARTARVRALAQRFALKIVDTRDDKIVCEVSGADDPFALIPEIEDDLAVRFVEPDLITIGNRMPDDRPPLPAADGPSTAGPGIAGVDRAEGSGNPPQNGHQNALTALAEALGDSRNRIAQSADQSPLMAVRITPTALSGGRQKTTNTTIARSINWARQTGADIITHGWEGALPSSDISEEFERARMRGRRGLGCVMVAVPDFASSLANVLGTNADIGWAYQPASDETGLASTTLSGACALILAANPGLTEGQVRELMAGACHASATAKPRRNRPQGAGGPHINVLGAVQSALAMAP